MRIKAIVNENDRRQETYIRFLKKAFPELLSETDPEMYYVIGGDGAMLHAHKNNNLSIPFFGKGLGTLNFIMNNFENDFKIIEGLQLGTIVPSVLEMQKINVTVKRIDGTSQNFLAVNDVVIGSNIMDWNKFIIASELGSFDNFELLGMGICISTPIGSTAFNFNNGGNVLPMTSNIWSFTGVVSNKQVNELMIPQQISIMNNSLRSVVKLYIDGTSQEIELSEGDTVILDKSNEVFKIAFLDIKHFFEKRTKLVQSKR